jgi:hypothetical protein
MQHTSIGPSPWSPSFQASPFAMQHAASPYGIPVPYGAVPQPHPLALRAFPTG